VIPFISYTTNTFFHPLELRSLPREVGIHESPTIHLGTSIRVTRIHHPLQRVYVRTKAFRDTLQRFCYSERYRILLLVKASCSHTEQLKVIIQIYFPHYLWIKFVPVVITSDFYHLCKIGSSQAVFSGREIIQFLLELDIFNVAHKWYLILHNFHVLIFNYIRVALYSMKLRALHSLVNLTIKLGVEDSIFISSSFTPPNGCYMAAE